MSLVCVGEFVRVTQYAKCYVYNLSCSEQGGGGKKEARGGEHKVKALESVRGLNYSCARSSDFEWEKVTPMEHSND